MFHRISTWWRALVVVVLGLATISWPAPVSAASSANFRIINQSVVSTLPRHGTGGFRITLGISGPPTITPTLNLTLYPALVTRSELNSVINGAGVTSTALATATSPLGCVKKGLASFVLTLSTQRSIPLASPCRDTRPQLHLTCSSSGCDGVYPLRYRLRFAGEWRTRWSLIVVSTQTIATPLRVALIANVNTLSLHHPRRAASFLRALALHSKEPLSLATNYLFLIGLDSQPTTYPLRASFTRALASPQHQIVNAPPSNTDFQGLAANHFSTQVDQQLALTDNLLQSVTGRYTSGPVMINGPTNVSSLNTLGRAGATDLVIPESALASPASDTLNWGEPFHVPGVANVTALTTDSPLANLAVNSTIEPGRRSVLALAALAFLHFEAPNAPGPRTVVLPINAARSNAIFARDFLSGLARSPFAQLSSLGPLFDSSLVGSDSAPVARALGPGLRSSNWSSRNVATLTTLIGDVNSYAPAASSPLIRGELHVAVARAETIGSANYRQLLLSRADNLLTQQLQNFSVDPSTITLAGPGTALPITVLSHADYTVTGVVHLITNRLRFPKGRSVAVTMNSPTNTVRLDASDPRGSSLTLQVLVTTPNDQLVLARTAIQVRFAGTSIVGYLLTALSIAVLAYWWYRTNRRKVKGRHAK